MNPDTTALRQASWNAVVAVALEEAGEAPAPHGLAAGAVVWRDGRVVDRFVARADPGTEALDAWLGRLPGDAVCLAHGSHVERAFRRIDAPRFAVSVLDTRILALICCPLAPSASLDALADYLSLPSDAGRTSSAVPSGAGSVPPPPLGEAERQLLRECEQVIRLWQALRERAQALPPALLSEINRLLAGPKKHRSPLREFFREAEAEARRKSLPRFWKPIPEMFDGDDTPPPRRNGVQEAARTPLDPESVTDFLSPTGALAQKLQGYENRDGQLAMARAVVEAFNGAQHLLVEAGTGIGKSLAYLVPAIRWATTNRTPVVVSTNTKNLQAQLFEKDIPLIRSALDVPFTAALLKGRMNYLCLRRMLYLLRYLDSELTADERVRMANVLSWAASTRTGDISENTAFSLPEFQGLLGRLLSNGEECMGRECRQQGRCFLRRARARAAAADVIVANHSLVFTDMDMANPTLPPYAHIVFDEAHNIEEAATRYLSVEVSRPRVRFLLNRLWRPGRKAHGGGVASSVEAQLESGALARTAGQPNREAQHAAEDIRELVGVVGAAMDAFLDALAPLVGPQKESRRIRAGGKRGAEWAPIRAAHENLTASLDRLLHATKTLSQVLRELGRDSLSFHGELVHDLDAAAMNIEELASDIRFVLAAEDPGYVCWVERAADGIRAWAAPLNIGHRLAESLYERKDTVVFCSATLSVRGSFDYLKRRLGIAAIAAGRVAEVNAGSPFDYERQCRVLVPLFLPEPDEPGRNYADELGRFLVELFRRTRGRALCLFTSYDMLKRTTAVVEGSMRGEAIPVLAQGISGSREHIAEVFKRDIASVLMGTHSFWEGVDFAGETLSCLVVARLPFAVVTDPIVEARCEELQAAGEDPFTAYSLPGAVVRFRQGFGRLIRRRTDRGVVVVADRRVVTKRYGGWFRSSLPAPTTPVADREQFLGAVEAFLAEAE